MQGSSDRPGRDDFHAVTFGGASPTRTAARPRQPKSPRGAGYHAKWIAINIVLLAATAYVYRYHLIPRYIHPGMDQTAGSSRARVGGDTDADRGAHAAARTDAVLDQGRGPADGAGLRLHRAEVGSEPRPAYVDEATLKELSARCIGNRVFRTQTRNGVTEIEELQWMRC